MADESTGVVAADRIVSEVQQTEFASPLDGLVAEYNERIGIRNEYLWKWLCTSFPFVTLDTVPEERREAVCTHKTILSMFVTLVDDLAENVRDEESFREATKIPFDQFRAHPEREGVDSGYLRFLEKVWETTESLLAETERHAEFRSFFEYDLRQALNAMDYERLANDHLAMMNTTEMMHYTPHNMVMLAAADIDLMNSPSFDRADLSTVRETVYRGQQLVRISNWASTWEREIDEGDFTSAVFAEAIARDVVSAADLEDLRRGDVDSTAVRAALQESQLEEFLLEEWDRRYADLRSAASDAESIDLDPFVDGVERVREYHMASKGYK